MRWTPQLAALCCYAAGSLAFLAGTAILFIQELKGKS